MTINIESFFSVYEIKQSLVTNENNIYIVTYLQNEYSLWLIKDGKSPERLLIGTEEITDLFFNSKQSQLVLIIRNEVGYKQLYELQKGCLHGLGVLEGSHVTILTLEEGKLIYSTYNKEKSEVLVYNLATNSITKLFELQDANLVLEAVHLASGKFLISRKTSKLYKELGVYSLDRGKIFWLLNKDKTTFHQLAFIEENLIQGICNFDHDRFYYFQYSTQMNSFTTICSFPWDVEGYLYLANQLKMLVSVNENGLSRLYLYNLITDTSKQLNNVPYGVIKQIHFSTDINRFYFCLESPLNPQNVWIGDMIEDVYVQKTNFVGPSNRNSLPETITIQSFDQTEVSFYYYESSDKLKEKPLLFYLHGGPESQIRPNYMPFFSYLQTKGFDVCVPNIRGSAGYGKRFLHLDDGKKRMDILRDIDEIKKWCLAHKDVNQENLFIMGRSYGGYATLKTIVHQPNVWRAAVSIAGMTNLKNFLLSLPENQRRVREMEYGSIGEIGDWLDEVSPLKKVEDINCPLMLIHGKNDFVVPHSEATNLVNALQHTSKFDYEFLSFQKEGHHIVNFKDVVYSFERIHAFLRNYLVN